MKRLNQTEREHDKCHRNKITKPEQRETAFAFGQQKEQREFRWRRVFRFCRDRRQRTRAASETETCADNSTRENLLFDLVSDKITNKTTR